jgi:hypothetical protein
MHGIVPRVSTPWRQLGAPGERHPSQHALAARGGGHGGPRTGQTMRLRRHCTIGRRRAREWAGNSFSKGKAHEQQERSD